MPEIRLVVEENVATLTLAAPERRNALTPQMARELVEACEEIDGDRDVGAVVVYGEADGFCAGAHRSTLGGSAEDPVEDGNFKDINSVYGAFERVGRLEPPTIAAVRGAAVGAGVNLLAATDLRIVAEDARIIAGFLRLRIHPGGGHFTLVNRVAGREAAAALGLFAQEIDGRRAAEVGLAWEALPAAQVEPRAHELARVPAVDPGAGAPCHEVVSARARPAGRPVAGGARVGDGGAALVAAARARRRHARRLTGHPSAAGFVDADAVDALLRGAGVPVAEQRVCADADEAAAAAAEIGYPVVLKLLAPALVHKSDVGGVLLDLGSEDAVRAAAARLAEVAVYEVWRSGRCSFRSWRRAVTSSCSSACAATRPSGPSSSRAPAGASSSSWTTSRSRAAPSTRRAPRPCWPARAPAAFSPASAAPTPTPTAPPLSSRRSRERRSRTRSSRSST